MHDLRLRYILGWTLTTATFFTCMLLPGTSHAEQPYQFQLYLGVAGDTEYETDSDDTFLSWDGDEDVESQYGLGAFYLAELDPKWHLGARLAYLSASGEGTDNHLSTVDLGPWLRFVPLLGELRPLIDLGLGASHVWVSNDNLDLSGFGWMLMLGGGAAYSVSSDVSLLAALYYSYQAFPKVSGEVELLGTDVDFEAEGSIGRFLLAFGVQF